MKISNKLATVLLATLGGLALATPPNLFECKGTDAVVGYSTSSFSGAPTFNVKTGSEDSRNYLGNQIRTQDSVVGKLVTVTKLAVPDLKVVTDTLVVPGINLTDRITEVAFDSVLIETTSRTSIAGPTLVQGLAQSSQFLPVHCTARKVFF